MLNNVLTTNMAATTWPRWPETGLVAGRNKMAMVIKALADSVNAMEELWQKRMEI